MKSTIHYYYGLDIKNIRLKNKVYYFEYLNDVYMMSSFNIKNKNILNYNIINEKIVKNKFGDYISEIDNNFYILEKKNSKDNTPLILYDILEWDNNSPVIDSINSGELANYYAHIINIAEKKFNQIKSCNKNIYESFNYYIGLAEISVALLNYKSVTTNMTIQNDNIDYNTKLLNFESIANKIVAPEFHNIVIFLKENNYDDHCSIKEELLKYYITKKEINSDSIIVLMAMYIFPNKYFDHIMSNECRKRVNKHDNYIDQDIKKVYEFLFSYTSLPKINWLLDI